tara:strand:+ start:340 stop:1239 length:900 start_codon:yes stop_codon:yes gene_type:complete
MVDGVATSLCDLGYCDVGLDDNWQECGHYGALGVLNFHDKDGNPIVNTQRFPDFNKMTDHAHGLGLTSGWCATRPQPRAARLCSSSSTAAHRPTGCVVPHGRYGNNCICGEHATSDKKFYVGDVSALRKFGFDSWKLDGCGSQTDLQLYDDLIKSTPATSGRSPIMVENCHWGSKVPFKPNATWCPWNFYRTSGDVRAKYSSVVGNLATTEFYAANNLSYPGCWAYPDMHAAPWSHPTLGLADPPERAACCSRVRTPPAPAPTGSRWAASTAPAARATQASRRPRRARTSRRGRSSRRL